LIFDDECHVRSVQVDNSDDGKSLIERLSMGLRLDHNLAVNHTDMTLEIPFVDAKACDITSPRISSPPTVLNPPTICTPVQKLSRSLGPRVCESTGIIEVLPLTSSALLTLFTAGRRVLDANASLNSSIDDKNASFSEDSGVFVSPQGAISPSMSSQPPTVTEDTTFSFVVSVGDIRAFALDPVLGPHLPVAVISLKSLSLTASQFALPERAVNIASSYR